MTLLTKQTETNPQRSLSAEAPRSWPQRPVNSAREVRAVRATELRASKEGDKQYLSGYAATFNTMSSPLKYFRERILPGAFDRALREKQDVRHLINHDENLILGRTTAGTTGLVTDGKGLKFRTLLPDTTYARDLVVSVDRGDVNECSFGFMVSCRDKNNPGAIWTEIPDPDDSSRRITVRDLVDVDLLDVSIVTYGAYPKTSAAVERSLWPDGVPAELRTRLGALRARAETSPIRLTPEELQERHTWRKWAELHQAAAESPLGLF